MLCDASTIPNFGNSTWALPRRNIPQPSLGSKGIPHDQLAGGFASFYYTDRKGMTSVDKVKSRRHYTATRGEESQWRLCVRHVEDRPKHRHVDRGKACVLSPLRANDTMPKQGKRFLEPPSSVVPDIDPSPTGQPRGKVMHSSGLCRAAQYRSEEQAIAQAMTRKGRCLTLQDQRNQCPVRNAGDKPYADCLYSKGFFARREVVPLPAAPLGKMAVSHGPDYQRQHDIVTVRNLPKIK